MGAQPSRFDVVTAGSSTAQEEYDNNNARNSNNGSDYVLQERNLEEPTPSPTKPKLKRVFSEEPSTLASLYAPMKMCFITLVSVTILALVVYLMIFGKISFNNEEQEGGGPEDEQSRFLQNKLTFCLLWMLLAATCLIGVGFMNFFKSFTLGSTIPSHYRIGLLVGAMLGFANTTMIGMLYFVGQNRNQEEGGSNDRMLESEDNNDDKEEEEGRVGTAILSFCILCSVMIVLYSALAFVVFWKHLSILHKDKDMGPNGTRTISPDEHVMTKSIAKATLLGEGWNVVSILTLVGMVVSLLIAPIPLIQDLDQERRPEGSNIVWNYIAILLHMTILTLVLYKVGRDVFGQGKTSSQIAVGTMSGFLFYLAATFFLLAMLFSSFQLRRERRREEEEMSTLGSGGFSVMCLFLAGIYTAFAVGVAKHHKAIIRANAKDIYSVEQWREPFMGGEMA